MDTFSNKKLCKSCNICKCLSEFHKNSNTKDGYLSDCKPCFNKKRRDKYQTKNKKEDDFSLMKQIFEEKIDEYKQKSLSSDDVDEIQKIHDEYLKNFEIYKAKLIEKSASSMFGVMKQIDEFEAKAVVQNWIFAKKKIMLQPTDVVVTFEKNVTKIQLPENMKLTPPEKAEIIALM